MADLIPDLQALRDRDFPVRQSQAKFEELIDYTEALVRSAREVIRMNNRPNGVTRALAALLPEEK